jgi:hypothetical protein
MLKQTLKTTLSNLDLRRWAYASAGVAGVFAIVAITANTHNYQAFAETAAGPVVLSSRGLQSSGSASADAPVSPGHTGTGQAATTGSAAAKDQSAGSGTLTAESSASNAKSSSTANSTSTTKAGGNKTTAPAPTPAPAGNWKYPLHTSIKTTWFYTGEPAGPDNGYIQNVSSAWQEDWQSYYGGSDDPYNRCGNNPCGFTPHENPFYFALPFSDFTNTGPVTDLSMVYWWDSGSRAKLNAGQSILKNRWIQISYGSKTVYGQWEDVGPFKEHDSAYVFGSSAPQYSGSGLDVSPAARDYLSSSFVNSGVINTSWRFVDYSEVPDGPWKSIITTSGPDWN